MQQSKNQYKYKSYAKLNLCLQITGKRPDGYHLLQSIFTKIDLADVIEISPQRSHITRGALNFMNDHDDDLCTKAAKLLKMHACKNSSEFENLGAHIVLQKNIPIGAGLGGGSSNAATVLQALNSIWQLNFSHEVLCDLALKLGADVPFFIQPTNLDAQFSAAWVEGIGEKLTPIILPKQYYIVFKPNVHSISAELFKHQNLKRDCPVLQTPAINTEFNWQTLEKYIALGNVMEPTFLEVFSSDINSNIDSNINSDINEINKILKNNLQMSGSGSCFFAIFETENLRDQSLEHLKSLKNLQVIYEEKNKKVQQTEQHLPLLLNWQMFACNNI